MYTCKKCPADSWSEFLSGLCDNCANEVHGAEPDLHSNCCDAAVYENFDLCTECGEHCAAVEEDGHEFHFSINRWVLAS
jgi:hypothetical protein